MNRSPAERSLAASKAANWRWATTDDRSAATAPAREAFYRGFELQVDPNGLLAPAERARRAASARKAYLAGIALKSARARRERRTAAERGAIAAEEPPQ